MHVAFAAGLLITLVNGISNSLLNSEGSPLVHFKTGVALGVTIIHLSMAVYVSNHAYADDLIKYYGRPSVLLAITLYNAFSKAPYLFFNIRSQQNRNGESKKWWIQI